MYTMAYSGFESWKVIDPMGNTVAWMDKPNAENVVNELNRLKQYKDAVYELADITTKYKILEKIK